MIDQNQLWTRLFGEGKCDLLLPTGRPAVWTAVRGMSRTEFAVTVSALYLTNAVSGVAS